MWKTEQQSKGTATSRFKMFSLIYLGCKFFKKMCSSYVFGCFVVKLVDIVGEA